MSSLKNFKNILSTVLLRHPSHSFEPGEKNFLTTISFEALWHFATRGKKKEKKTSLNEIFLNMIGTLSVGTFRTLLQNVPEIERFCQHLLNILVKSRAINSNSFPHINILSSPVSVQIGQNIN
jgi:hypothetical protein